jgi:ribosomal protein S6--L-glutamate ligase
MILSFHPIYEGDHNRICAGRDPDDDDLAVIQQAAIIILPQGCRQSLYRAATQYDARVFPNYDARFAYPGKVGQSRLFEAAGVPHPPTVRYAGADDFFRRHPDGKGPFRSPAVVKLDWGGEGESVFPFGRDDDLPPILRHVQECEATGQQGFIIQPWIPAAGRSLRVVVMGPHMVSYWRTVPDHAFGMASLARGGAIDRTSDPRLIAAAEGAAAAFCRQTAINLAGFDFLFSTDPAVADAQTPLFIEINYFFGRRGLGGSDAYYRKLLDAIEHWVAGTDSQEPPTTGDRTA